MSKKYQRFGLRRGNNLSDVPSPNAALGNILNDLSVEGELFQPNDLYVSIKGLIDTDVRKIDLTDLAGKQVLYFDQNRIPRVVQPLITIKDQIDNYKLISGDPPFLSGGDGPLAYFIRSSDIEVVTANSTSIDLYANTAVEFGPYVFWTNGTFSLPNYVFEDFPDPDGMIKWEGFFSPNINSLLNQFLVSSSGLVFVEAEINGTYETLLNIYAADREISYTSATATTVTSLNIGSQIKHVGIDDLVKEVNGIDVSANAIRIRSINVASQTISLSGGISVDVGANSIVFGFEIGSESITSRFNIDSSSIDTKIPMRIFNWWPRRLVGDNETRESVFRYLENGEDGNYLNYTNFYSVLPTSSNILPESIEYFFNNYLQPKKQKTSEEVLVDNQISIEYIPPTLVSDKLLATATITSQAGLEVTATNLFTNASIGDYIYVNNPTGENIFQINRKLTDSRVILEGDVDTIDNISGLTAYIIDHMGLVGIYDAVVGATITVSEVSANTFPLFDPNGFSLVRDDMLVSDFIGSTNFMRIANMVEGVGSIEISTLNVAAPETMASGPIFVYRDKGLIDQSKLLFCQGVTAKEIAAQALSGDTLIELTSVDGTEVGQFAQFEGVIAAGTTITAANTVSNIIVLSQPTTGVLLAGETITLSPDNINREVCNIALNTAPPFEGTERGLITVAGNEGIEANEIVIERLEITINTPGDVSNILPTSLDYTQTLDITSNGQTYRLLIV